MSEYIKTNHKAKLKIPENFEIAADEMPIEKNLEDLVFYNGYGGFSQDGREYTFCVNKDNVLPTIWSNVISNKSYGVITTENMYDLIWNKNSRLNRITAWNNDTVCNIPSQIIYLKDEENHKIWTLNSNVLPNPNYYYVTYGFGYSKYKNVYDDILQQVDLFVPCDDNVAVTKIRLKNTSDKVKKLRMIIYIKTVLGEDENHSNGNCYFEKNGNTILMKNMLNSFEFNKIAYFSSNIKIKDFTKSKRVFFGGGSLSLPDCLFVNNFESCSGIGDCLGIEFEVSLKEYEEDFLIFSIGQENTLLEVEKMSNKLKNIEYIDKSLTDANRKWMNLISNLNIRTPDNELNILVNGWLVYQTIGCRLWGKSGFYQSGGANGFRDQLQDCLGMKYIDSNLLKEQIKKCCRHQFIEGDVLHWWHDETKKGVRTRFSDDLLWLPYGVFEYISFSNDEDILEEQIEYLAGEKLQEAENEVYRLYFASEIKESIYKHCIRAIDKACNFGEMGLPKIGSGDWNDGFSNVGIKGKGESVWLGFFLYDVLNKFSKICEKRQDYEKMEQYNRIKEELKKNLNTNAWDGRWYKRAIMDDGTEIGSIESQECKIDSISQSWSVISGAGDNDKKYISMQEVQNRLVDKDNKLIKLFTPPFSNWEINPRLYKSLSRRSKRKWRTIHTCCHLGHYC